MKPAIKSLEAHVNMSDMFLIQNGVKQGDAIYIKTLLQITVLKMTKKTMRGRNNLLVYADKLISSLLSSTLRKQPLSSHSLPYKILPD
jgi:hypothetical protein